MLCKGRVFETFRSLFAQRPTQSSVLRRSMDFSAEVVEHAHISRIASRDLNMLAQEGIVECIPGLSARFVIKSPSTDPGRLSYNSSEKSFTLLRSRCLRSFLLFFQDVGTCSRSAERCRCLTNGRSSHVNIERYSHRLVIE